MAITELPASPSGEISHGDVREKTNELVYDLNALNKSVGLINKKVHVFVLGGQSNMEGQGVHGILPDFTSNIYQYKQNGKVGRASHALDHEALMQGTSSLAVTFCKQYLLDNPEVQEIHLIPCAKGDTGFISNDWNPTNYWYTQLVDRTNSYFTDYPDSEFKGLLWHQGEKDVNADATYLSAVETTFAGFRSEITAMSEDTPIICGTLLNSWVIQAAQRQTIDDIIKDFPLTIPNCAVAISDVNSSTDDGIHFSAENGLDLLGVNYANTLNTLTNKTNLDVEVGAVRHIIFGGSDEDYATDLTGASLPQPNRSHPNVGNRSIQIEGAIGGLDTFVSDKNQITYCAVIKRTSESTDALIGGCYNGADNLGHMMYLSGSGISFWNRDWSNVQVAGSPSVVVGDYYFVAFALDVNEFTAFVGRDALSRVRNDTGLSNRTLSTKPYNIGIHNISWQTTDFAGALDFSEFIVFDEYKTSAELEDIYRRSRDRMAKAGIVLY